MRAAHPQDTRPKFLQREVAVVLLASAFLTAAVTARATETCVGSGAHAKHLTYGFDCTVCHPCPGVVTFGSLLFPGGTNAAGGAVSMAGGVTCSQGCHSPFGAAPSTVSWTQGGLSCTECHTDAIPSPVPAASSHTAAAGVAAASCASCHDQSQHTKGQVRLLNGDGSSTSTTCVGCHSGEGQTLGGAAPPLLVGWDDTVRGDFHGARDGTCRYDVVNTDGQVVGVTGGLPCPAGQPPAPGGLKMTARWWYVSGVSGPWSWTCDIQEVDGAGNNVGSLLLRQPCPEGVVKDPSCNNPANPCALSTLVTRGFGGTLKAPYVRSQGALPCWTCHDAHASSNAFLLADQVNGKPIAPATINRAGVGAETLCEACHQGDRHQICKNCHAQTWTTDGEYSWFEGPPVDPAPPGAACFYCHGHEGLLKMKVASPAYPSGGHPFGLAGQDKSTDECSHCHSAWAPPPIEYAAPAFTAAPAVTGVTATTATVSWTTNEPATTYVEYGVGAASRVVGNGSFVRDHSVALTGLAPGTTYTWRIRTGDSFQNLTKTALQTFTTPQADAVPKPDLVPVGWAWPTDTPLTVNLVWHPVTAPSGAAVQYEVELWGTSSGNSGWIPGTPTTSGGKPALSFAATLANVPTDDCMEPIPNATFYWRVRARDVPENVSAWSATDTFLATIPDSNYCGYW